MDFDLHSGSRGLRAARPTSRSASRRSSRCSTPADLGLVPRFEELRDAAAADPVLADSIAGELISSEIEIRSGRGADLAAAILAQRDRRRRLFGLAAEARHRARRHRHPPVVGLPRAADHPDRALPPRRGGAQVRRLAQQHLLAARPRRDPRRRPRGARLRSAAPECCRCCWRSRPTRPFLDGRDSGLHSARTQTFTRSFPRCGVPDPFGSWDAFGGLHRVSSSAPTRSSSTRRCGGRSDRILSFGTVEVRICDAQATAAESEGLAALIVACVAQAARDIDEGVAKPTVPGRLIEENMWRAIRYGLDGKLLDLERATSTRRPRHGRAAAGVDRAGPRRAGDRVALPDAQRRPAPAAAWSRRGLAWARSMPPRSPRRARPMLGIAEHPAEVTK